jgi:octaprenyl-diphosphate synthase
MTTAAATSSRVGRPSAQLKPILAPIENELRAVDALIREWLNSDVVLINALADHIVHSGGKRLRPAVVLLAARACGYRGDRHVLLDAIIEFIHTATLLHDDVVDASEQRRGRDTANALWGNSASVLTGDFLYSRSFQMMVELDDMAVMRVLADATNRIAEGEVLQLMNCHNPDLTEADYLEVTERKTASLFAAGCRLAAALNDGGKDIENAMEAYGRHLGIAFQVVDDALDYGPGDGGLGKNVGDDLQEGKTTLPLIRALQKAEPDTAAALRKAIEDGDSGALPTVQKAIESSSAMAYTLARAEGESQAAVKALSGIPESPYKSALLQLAEFCLKRSY